MSWYSGPATSTVFHLPEVVGNVLVVEYLDDLNLAVSVLLLTLFLFLLRRVVAVAVAVHLVHLTFAGVATALTVFQRVTPTAGLVDDVMADEVLG